MLTLGHLLAALTGYQPAGSEPPISAAVIDSRLAGPGSMFVALPGQHLDGHDFLADAFARGAVVALVTRPVPGPWQTVDLRQGAPATLPALPLCLQVEDAQAALQRLARYWRRRFEPTVVGITGSVGKTSTKELVFTVLSQRHRTLKSEGNYNNELGLPLTLLNLDASYRFAVLEMGTYAQGEIGLLCDLAQPHIGVVTIIGPVHMERLGSLEAIVAAKQELVEALPADGVAILNYDEPLVMGMAAHTQARVFTYGLSAGADLRADEISSMGLEGIRFSLHHGQTVLRLQVPLLGRHSVHTALRAAAVGLVAGLTWDEIVAGLQDQRAQLRLVAVEGPEGSWILDDTYNSSPASALAALNLLAELDGRRIAVLGDMLELGSAEVASHILVGRRAREVADILVTVGPLARLIGEAACQAGMPAAAIHQLPDAGSAIKLLEQLIQRGDVTLIKGSRGVELERVVAALSRA